MSDDNAQLREHLAALSQWIDNGNPGYTELENLVFRTTVKIGEELGEVNQALIGMIGQNPRKGVTHNRDDLEKEVLDVAVTALGAIEHMRGNSGSSLDLLAAHVARTVERAGLAGLT